MNVDYQKSYDEKEDCF